MKAQKSNFFESFLVKNKKPLVIFFIMILAHYLLVLVIGDFRGEFIGYILIGCSIPLFKWKKLQYVLLGFFTTFAILAIFLDPILKNSLDKLPGANTVSTFSASVFLNLFVLSGLYLGYVVFKFSTKNKFR